MSELSAQEAFDRMLISQWKLKDMRVFQFCLHFLRRMGVEKTEDIEADLKALRVARRPDMNVWRYKSISGWLAAAYPSFLDSAAACGDARRIRLSALRFNAKATPVKRDQSTQHMKDKSRKNVQIAITSHLANKIRHNGHANKLRGKQ